MANIIYSAMSGKNDPMQNSIAALNALTKTVIPITNVCPEPMPMYNSWTAPTTATTAAG